MNWEKGVALLKQPSTWRGIAIIATALGYTVNPAVALIIGGLIAGAVEVFRDEG